MAEVVSVKWEGLPALEMRAGGLSALVLPGIGGNCLALWDSGGDYLRKPASLAQYLTLPEAFGLPVLFPPNRIEKGAFSAGGRNYQFPLNKGAQHLHGFVYERPWRVDKTGADGGAASLEMSFYAGTEGEIRQWFPHAFKISLSYRLDGAALRQTIRITNLGDTPMPMMQGYHAAFALQGRDKGEEYKVRIALGEEIKGVERLPLPPEAALFREGRPLKAGDKIFGHYSKKPLPDGFSGALIENLSRGRKLRFETGGEYPYWVLWNQGGDDSFLCIEPQTCVIGAANLHAGDESRPDPATGFTMLPPLGVFSGACVLAVEN